MQNTVITICCAFTRYWAVDRWLKDLASVEHDPAKTNLAFIVDMDAPSIKRKLERFVKDKNYRNVEILLNKHSPNEVRTHTRRQRISFMKNQSKALVNAFDGDIVIGLEDDTIFGHLKCFCRLIEPLESHKNVGFVQGVQCGRWGVKMIGAWNIDNPVHPTRAETLLPPEKPDYQQISAGGFYGYATRKSLYLNHDYYSSTAQPYGPDVNFGLWVKQMGLECLIDWQTVFGHNDHNSIIWPDVKLSKVVYNRDVKTGKWKRHDTDKAS